MKLGEKIKQLRKSKDFNITDRIYIYYYSDTLIEKLENFIDKIKRVVLVSPFALKTAAEQLVSAIKGAPQK